MVRCDLARRQGARKYVCLVHNTVEQRFGLGRTGDTRTPEAPFCARDPTRGGLFSVHVESRRLSVVSGRKVIPPDGFGQTYRRLFAAFLPWHHSSGGHSTPFLAFSIQLESPAARRENSETTPLPLSAPSRRARAGGLSPPPAQSNNRRPRASTIRQSPNAPVSRHTYAISILSAVRHTSSSISIAPTITSTDILLGMNRFW